MKLTIFDLDETLISIDSDHAWGEYVADQGLVDPASHRRQNEAFYEDYKRGQLDIHAYCAFACRVLSLHSMDTLFHHRKRFIEQVITPHVLPKAQALVTQEREQGNHVMIVTATMEFVTRPIADLFGIEDLIAPVPELKDGVYTGNITGVPSFGEGKVTRLKSWLKDNHFEPSSSRFYSDSHNDLPLLELVDEPVAVNPDPKLKAIATERGWACISLR